MSEMRTDGLNCESARESWLTADSPETELAGPIAEHLAGCSDCRAFQEQMAADQTALRAHFQSMPVPTPPEITVRGPLQSASGHPRRISLTLMPFLWTLLLGLGAVGALTFLVWWSLRQGS